MENLGTSLNRFLRQLFDELPRAEEAFFSKAKLNLSARESHLIQEVCLAVDSGRDNRATAIAAARHVTAGTLTASVSLLERKGYLERRRDAADRRVVRIFPTARGREVNERLAAYHRDLTERITASLREEDKTAFLAGLEKVVRLFSGRGPAKAELPPV